MLRSIIEAKHMCVSSRGIEDEQSSTVTADYHGALSKTRHGANFWTTFAADWVCQKKRLLDRWSLPIFAPHFHQNQQRGFGPF